MRVIRHRTLAGGVVERFIPETAEEEAELQRRYEEHVSETPDEPATFEDFLHPG